MIELNPILRREVRARWRHWPAFAVVFGYAILLALLMGYQYALLSRHDPGAVEIKFGQRLQVIGRGLFSFLTEMQALVWMLLAPVLTATSIAAEREHGLLESLQLAPLSPRRIVLGKLLSALSFIALMLLVPLPVIAICFLMGGVSPGEFGLAVLLHTVTAITSATVGLFCSAWSRRAMGGLRTTFLFLVVWGLGSALAFRTWTSWYLPSPSPTQAMWDLVLGVVGQANPVIAAVTLVDPDVAQAGQFAWPAAAALDAPPWMICMVVQGLLSLVLLWSATRAVSRPFAEQYWIERKSWLDRLKSLVPQSATEDAVPATSNTPTTEPAMERWKRQAQHALWWELPLVSSIRFSNPILQRELRGKFRLRATGLWTMAPRLVVGGVVLYFYVQELAGSLNNPSSRASIWWIWSYIGLIAVILAAAIMGAGAFTREREAGTWESLLLSSLTPHDILTAKLGVPLLTCFAYSWPLWPLLIPCITLSQGFYQHNISLSQAIATVLVVAMTVWFCTLLGMLFSWLCRHTVIAVSCTLGTLCVAFIFLPMLVNILLENFSKPRGGPAQSAVFNPLFIDFNIATINLLRPFNPFIALHYIANKGFANMGSSFSTWVSSTKMREGGIIYAALPVTILLFAAGCVLLAILYVGLWRDSKAKIK